eukprot:16277547-Heterocapsa_arctica.AAC.1
MAASIMPGAPRKREFSLLFIGRAHPEIVGSSDELTPNIVGSSEELTPQIVGSSNRSVEGVSAGLHALE